ncbi:hypothetical protein JTB14_038235 [Gonioctena quinquepunctata]|nr:hypothetical protein JTB14_038235 [Gonioctena quinquepunctata]
MFPSSWSVVHSFVRKVSAISINSSSYASSRCNGAFFNHGTVLLKSPSSSSIASIASASSSSSSGSTSSGSTSSGSTSSSATSESGFSSLTTEIEKADYYLDVIAKLEQRFQILCELPKYVYRSSNTEVIYENRNVLDLAGNLNPGWRFKHAVLQNGVNHFFENRSQLSRLDGAEPPAHILVPCDEKDCSFIEPLYF